MGTLADRLERFLDSCGGLLPLKPCLVGRGYRGGGRLAGRGPGVVRRRRDGRYLVERWIASSTRVGWGGSSIEEGLSLVSGFRPAMRLRDALHELPDSLLGPARAAAHGGEFRVLTKILDPYDPIGFHFHQKDQEVQAHPDRFPGERFGKDEAYYFLPGPKGPWPYTHVGIRPDVSRERILEAILAGREALLEISPHLLPRAHTGFFVPAGLVHSPGTVLTLEVQQPSDVGRGFGVYGGRDASENDRQVAAEKALAAVDLDLCQAPDLLERNLLLPQRVESSAEPLRQWWILPPHATPKFSAKRIVAEGASLWRESDCFALLVWSGQGRINDQVVGPGHEFFVPHRAALQGLRVEPGEAGFEAFAVFAASV